MRRLTTALMALVALCACTSIDCPVENNVATYYKVMGTDGKEATLSDTLTVITKLANGTDSVILNKSVDTKTFQLPVSYTNAADTFFFVRQGEAYEIIDTLWLEKTNLPQFESVDCKLVYFHDVLSLRHTGHAIDSISIKKGRIDYDSNTENFHIYFKADI
ncbi:MAG: DUF6452 family protein [Prevotella sp.]